VDAESPAEVVLVGTFFVVYEDDLGEVGDVTETLDDDSVEVELL